MNRIPDALFAQMMPRAIAWAEGQEQQICSRGISLDQRGDDIARLAGVQQRERVRLLAVSQIPLPDEADLRRAAQDFGLLTTDTGGLTIGYGIYVLQKCWGDVKLVAHELKHVFQYEQCGGISGFLKKYLSEINEYGYPAAPMEQDAISFAYRMFPNK
jgi:hypothetical protein